MQLKIESMLNALIERKKKVYELGQDLAKFMNVTPKSWKLIGSKTCIFYKIPLLFEGHIKKMFIVEEFTLFN